jgi:hypothetical protein
MYYVRMCLCMYVCMYVGECVYTHGMGRETLTLLLVPAVLFRK